MKRFAVVALLFAAAMLSPAAGFSQAGGPGDDFWVNATPAQKYYALKKATSNLRQYSGDAGVAELQRVAGLYPFTGIGIEYGPFKGRLIWAVWKGSPADKAGVLPGDVIVRVNGNDVCISSGAALESDPQTCMTAIMNAIGGAPGAVILDIVRPPDRTKVLHIKVVGKALIGSDWAAFIAAHLERWRMDILRNGALLERFDNDLEQVKADDARLNKLYVEIFRLAGKITGPWREMDAERMKLVKQFVTESSSSR